MKIPMARRLFAALRTCSIVFLLFTAAAVSLHGQTLSTASFNGADGANPEYGALIQGHDGNFYGTTSAGGANGDGAIFMAAPGTLTLVYSFCAKANCGDGKSPYGGLMLGTDGNFYGTTQSGGANGYGTIFKYVPGVGLTTLYNFCAKSGCTDGANPVAGLIQAANGNFYGTTEYGGANDMCGAAGCGTVFKITKKGKLTTLYSFCSKSDCSDGELPTGALIQGKDKKFYGTTFTGTDAIGSFGTIFKITGAGKLSTLYNFCSKSGCVDGAAPHAGLIQATDGNFYGTTEYGGANDFCEDLGDEVGCGTVFKITTKGKLTTLYSFCSLSGCADGELPTGGLIQATDGNFYGTTFTGTNEFASYGTIFEITPAAALTTLYSFCSKAGCADGSFPLAGLVQGADGSFYGTTVTGGASGDGTAFRFSTVLGGSSRP